MSWIAHLAVLSGVGHWRSISHALSCFRIIRRTRLRFEEFLKALAALLCRETRQDCVHFGSPNIQDKGQHVVESHHLHADMRVIYHPHGPATTGCLTLIEET